MKNLNNFLTESLINKKPKDLTELQETVAKLLKERGNNADLNDIDVSNITNMSRLFYTLDPRQIDISQWDVSNVTDMTGMFFNCKDFNSDLSKWNVSNVKSLDETFKYCEHFRSNLENWDVKNVKSMRNTFDNCNPKVIPSWYKK